ncbi:flagellar filament capping protein FliD [Mixta intestinalis]|uniref:Flagellar hook-associated protein 2 n=1 Tax=Mixta intestinalis TaxID=1615494 RepID=A0A6P1Q5K6_9GAMM|nr:flagellar filament capping protein FliD [Mixta intestinalis]QHM73218.1 Flagellar hook-associated protein 2 [Mixta intestinalis]
MATLSSLGIGSGLDTATMLAQMKTAEQTRLNPYTNLKSSYENKISAWGKISSALSSLQTTIKKLSGEAFNTLTVSDNKAFQATATSDADADSHSVTVSQLATGHKLKTAGQTSNETQLGEQAGGSRTLTITQKNGKEVKVTLKDDETSLEQIAKKINKEDGDVRASVQRTGSEYVLVLSSRTTGTDGEMSVNVEGDDKLANILNTSKGGKSDENDTTSGDKMISIAQAQDAELTVDGIKYTRSSNSISDIITGVTLNLKSVSENGASEQLTLNVDNTAIKSTLQDFVKQYNALLTQTSAASKYVPKDTSGLTDDQVATTSSENGALMGDGTLRSLVGELRSAINGVYGDSGADYDSLASLGIKIDAATGQMTLDEKKLDKAIEDNPEEVGRIFKGRGDSEGLASVLSETVTKYVGDTENKKDGLIKGMTDSLDEQVKLVKEQIDKTQKLIDAQVERYRVQFQNLDSTMSQLNNLSNQLTAVLSTIG